MTTLPKPGIRPADPRFSAGPTKKRPGWTLDALKGATLGRSHRSADAKAKLKELLDRTRDILALPQDYRMAIVPASDTGAVEMAMWSLLGPRGVDVAAWENFGLDWVNDVQHQLALKDVRFLTADYGQLPPLETYTPERDLVFTWNGTTSGVRVPNADFIPTDRQGLTICDATSAIFAQALDWHKLDVLTYSWQKNMGGEAAHGMIILSPRAVERLLSYTPPWPVPKIFRLTHQGRLNESLFEGVTINTPSMLCVEDHLDALKWVQSQGGLAFMHQRANENAQLLWDWMARTDWVENLATIAEQRSNTGVCMKIVDPRFCALSADAQTIFCKKITSRLETEYVALDIGAYQTAPPGFRIWSSGLIETSDLHALTLWLDWAFSQIAHETFNEATHA